MRLTTVTASVLCVLVLAACGGSGDVYEETSSGAAVSSGAPKGGCDMKVVEKAAYCANCRQLCGPACPTDDKGNCKACGKPTAQVDVCVKHVLACNQCKRDHDKACALQSSYKCCTDKKIVARVVCTCGNSTCSGDSCQRCKQGGGCKRRCLH